MRTEMFEAAEKKTYPAHSIIFRENDPGDCYFVILSGKVRVFRTGRWGRDLDLSMLGPGDGFGEWALLTGETRSASVETLEESNLLVVDKKQFTEGLKNDPDVSLSLIKQISTGLVQNDSIIESEAERQSKAPNFAWHDCLFLVVISILCGIIFNLSAHNGMNLIPRCWSDKTIPIVAPQTVMEKYLEGSLFVDARPNIFFKQGHINGAVNVPSALFDIMYMMEISKLDKNKHIIVYGRTISRRYDENVARKFVLRGHKNTLILEGGLSAWKKKGYPIKS